MFCYCCVFRITSTNLDIVLRFLPMKFAENLFNIYSFCVNINCVKNKYYFNRFFFNLFVSNWILVLKLYNF
jgi:hypothetical protein